MRRNDVICLVLGGGRGTRLDPLTRYRSKPAVPIGGKFRLVDIPISNSLNADLRRIMVLTQFNSASLNTHITRTYQFDLFGGGFVRILAAEQTDQTQDWFQGTADAVRRCLPHFRLFQPKDVLILSGDQLYRMDFAPLLKQHRRSGAAVTLAAKAVSEQQTSAFGLVRIGADKRVESFLEKPKDPAMLAGYEVADDMRDPTVEGPQYAASMGIYVFRFDALRDALESTHHVDFGHGVLPEMVGSADVRAFPFHGYWEDIGTIRAFYDANLALATRDAPFRFHEPNAPIYTEPRFLGASRIEDCRVVDSLVCDGCRLQGESIEGSVIGIRSVIRSGTRIAHSLLMGADGYEGDLPREPGAPALGVGRDCSIEGAIIDKNARIGDRVRITPKPPGTHEDHAAWFVRDGIVIVPKAAVVPAGTVI